MACLHTDRNLAAWAVLPRAPHFFSAIFQEMVKENPDEIARKLTSLITVSATVEQI